MFSKTPTSGEVETSLAAALAAVTIRAYDPRRLRPHLSSCANQYQHVTTACQLVPMNDPTGWQRQPWNLADTKRETQLADARRLFRWESTALRICSHRNPFCCKPLRRNHEVEGLEDADDVTPVGNLLGSGIHPVRNLPPRDLLHWNTEAEDFTDADGFAFVSQGEAAELRTVLKFLHADRLLHLYGAHDYGS